jgi:hypothetical protein
MQNKVLRHGNQWYAIECVRLCTWKLRHSTTVGTVFSAGTQPWCVVFTPTNTNDLRNYIKATVGFPELVERTHTPKNGLMRMFSPRGNRPRAICSASLLNWRRRKGSTSPCERGLRPNQRPPLPNYWTP